MLRPSASLAAVGFSVGYSAVLGHTGISPVQGRGKVFYVGGAVGGGGG